MACDASVTPQGSAWINQTNVTIGYEYGGVGPYVSVGGGQAKACSPALEFHEYANGINSRMVEFGVALPGFNGRPSAQQSIALLVGGRVGAMSPYSGFPWSVEGYAHAGFAFPISGENFTGSLLARAGLQTHLELLGGPTAGLIAFTNPKFFDANRPLKFTLGYQFLKTTDWRAAPGD